MTVSLTFTTADLSVATPTVSITQANGVVTATPANVPSGKTAQYTIEIAAAGTENWIDARSIASQSANSGTLDFTGNEFTFSDSGYEGYQVRVKMGVTEDNSKYNYISNIETLSGIPTT